MSSKAGGPFFQPFQQWYAFLTEISRLYFSSNDSWEERFYDSADVTILQ